MMDYQESINLLTSQGKFHINLGLERMQKIMGLLCNPQDELKYIHVAGTNGKGSTCAILNSILTCNGYKTGLFTSPHIFQYTERIKINNQEISQEIFAQEIEKITALADKNNIHLTEFEIITAAAFDYFYQNKVDIVILETGLGGRLDATNIIKKNLCSIITHIDLDHTERLGESLDQIAFEKAGIIKQNCPVIINKNNKGLKTIKQIAIDKKSEIFLADFAPSELLKKLALKGKWQKENLAVALIALEVLKSQNFVFSEKDLIEGLENTKHACRFEYIKEYNLLIDGAHNPNGAKALRESLEEIYPKQKYRFIFGCLKNKDYKQMMQNLFKKNDEIYFYHFNYPNSAHTDELKAACEYKSKEFSFDKLDSSKLNIICGSFYMIKELVDKMGIK